MAKIKIGFIATLFTSIAFAAAVTYNLTALPVTTYTDGTTITVPVTYNFYAGDCVAAPTMFKSGSSSPAFSYAQPDGSPQICVYATAVAGTKESALSPNPYVMPARPLPEKTPMAPAGVKKQ